MLKRFTTLLLILSLLLPNLFVLADDIDEKLSIVISLSQNKAEVGDEILVTLSFENYTTHPKKIGVFQFEIPIDEEYFEYVPTEIKILGEPPDNWISGSNAGYVSDDAQFIVYWSDYPKTLHKETTDIVEFKIKVINEIDKDITINLSKNSIIDDDSDDPIDYTLTPAVLEITTNAETPTIGSLPDEVTYTQEATSPSLELIADVPTDGGTLSYQWYSKSEPTDDGIFIVDATSETFMPPTDTPGTTYYYVVVTNTNEDVNGIQTASITSNTVKVTVVAPVNAETPNITEHPRSATYTRCATSPSLKVIADVPTDGGTLSYQWYSKSEPTDDGILITDATSESFMPPTDTLGTTYYYVVVTNTNNDSSITGSKTASVTSNTAKIEVVAATHTISFNSHGGETVDEKEVTEDGEYGELPIPKQSGFKFDGWYTFEGDKIESTTVVALGNTPTTQTLHAHWIAKAGIEINESAQIYTYDGNAKQFVVNVTSTETPSPETIKFNISYNPLTPINADTYDVTVFYPEDDNYKAFTKTIIGGLVINRSEITEITDLPTATDIKEGQPLSTSVLSGGDSRFTYEWTSPNTTPELGTAQQSVTVTLKTEHSQNYSYTVSNYILVDVTVSEYIAPTISTTSLPNGTLNNQYNQTIMATGEPGYPIIFTWESGTLPTGLILNQNGTISGIPTEIGLYEFTVKATNIGGYDFKTYTVEINEIPTLDIPTNLTFVNGIATWSPVTGATSYRVVLYRNNQLYNEVETENTRYDFASFITDEGNYTVTVQALGDGVNSNSSSISGESAVYVYVPPTNNMYYWAWIPPIFINQTYKIKATVEIGGIITPSGTTEISAGNSQQYIIEANTGYIISDVIVDGISVGAVETYQFNNVYDNHTIKAVFEKAPTPVVVDETLVEDEIKSEWSNPFNDISENDNWYDAIRYVYENGLFKGTSDVTFSPDVTMNRAMFVTVLGRYADVDINLYTKADKMFDDVEANQWYTPYIQWAYENGLILGYGDGIFGTFDVITHEHMYLIMDRFLTMIDVDYKFENDKTTSKSEVKRYEVAELLYELFINIK